MTEVGSTHHVSHYIPDARATRTEVKVIYCAEAA